MNNDGTTDTEILEGAGVEAELAEPAELELDSEARPDAPTELRTIDHWREVHGTEEWLFKAARVGLQWPHGQELLEETYLAGIKWAATVPCR